MGTEQTERELSKKERDDVITGVYKHFGGLQAIDRVFKEEGVARDQYLKPSLSRRIRNFFRK